MNNNTNKLIKTLTIIGYTFTGFSLILAFMPLWRFTLIPSFIAVAIALYIRWYSRIQNLPNKQTKRIVIVAIFTVVLGFTLGLSIKAKLPNDPDFKQKIEKSQNVNDDLNDALNDPSDTISTK